MLFKQIVIFLALSAFTSEISDVRPTQVISSPSLLLYIYHPQCISCQLQMLQLQLLDINSSDRSYQVKKLNCADHKDFCNSLQKTFPAIFYYFHGDSVLYEGQIQASLLDAWVKEITTFNFPTISQSDIKSKKRSQNFVLFGGLTNSQKIQVSALKSVSYLNISFYETESKNPLLRLHTYRSQNPLEYTFPLNIRLLSYQLFHRTRDFVMSLDNQKYLYYFKNHRDSEETLMLFDHHDHFSQSATPILNYFCHEFLLSVFCFKVDKQSSLYSDIAKNPSPPQNLTSVVYFKQNKQKGYIFPYEKIRQSEFRNFIKQAREDKRVPNYDNTPKKDQKFKFQSAVQLDNKTFKKTLNNNPIVFIKFYSPFCKHCNILAPHYDYAAKHFKDKKSPILLGTIDCQEFTAIADQQAIRRYPTFKLFLRGQPIEYQGQRSSTAIIDFLESIFSANLPLVSNFQEIKKPALVISGINSTSNLHFLPAFYSSLPIYLLKDQSSLKVNIYWQDDSITKFTGKVTLNSVLKWLENEGQPIILDLGSSKVSKKLTKAIKQNTPILGIMDKGHHPLTSVEKFLEKYCKNQVNLVCGKARKGQDDYQNLVEWIGDQDQTKNTLVYLNLQEMKSYIFEGDIYNLMEQDLNMFIENILNGAVPQSNTKTATSQNQGQVQKDTRNSASETTNEPKQEHLNSKQANTQL